MNAPARRDDGSAIMERVLAEGDLSKLTAAERNTYYLAVCKSLGLNGLTRPFLYIMLNGKLTLYATKGATDQLRKINGVSLRIAKQEFRGDLFIVTCEATDREGRVDSDMGVVSIANMRGETLANQMLRAVTKSKRRATLSIVGLGWLSEDEIESVPAAAKQPWHEPDPLNDPDPDTGEVVDHGRSSDHQALEDAADAEARDTAGEDDDTVPYYQLSGIDLTAWEWIDAAGKEARHRKPEELRAWWREHAPTRAAIVEAHPEFEPMLRALREEVAARLGVPANGGSKP